MTSQRILVRARLVGRATSQKPDLEHRLSISGFGSRRLSRKKAAEISGREGMSFYWALALCDVGLGERQWKFVGCLRSSVFHSGQNKNSSLKSGTFRRPQPPVLSQKYCRTNGRRTAVQMGSVLQCKWDSRPRSQEGTTIQMGGVLLYKLEVYCSTFFETDRGERIAKYVLRD